MSAAGPAWAREHDAPELDGGKAFTRYAVAEETFTIGQDWEHTNHGLVPASPVEVSVEAMTFNDEGAGWSRLGRALAWARHLVTELERVQAASVRPNAGTTAHVAAGRAVALRMTALQARHGWTAATVAQRARIPRTRFLACLDEQSPFNVDELASIAAVFGLDTFALMSGAGREHGGA
ncbi:hypothetical protein [Demequina sp. NBRC 110055]|uniref:hypothetical protein n=1 Tax=Demequina sp. NBRC 110055 TaxID=1570344 RepID=UPI000A006870|nr:hypothetical protein [Demequina sp. NBRC 110055]